MLAEHAGLERPYRIQSLLGRGSWSADHVRNLVRDYVAEVLGDEAGVLVIDETGFMKKGLHSVGVGRQYSGTAGHIENCQVGVFAAYTDRQTAAGRSNSPRLGLGLVTMATKPPGKRRHLPPENTNQYAAVVLAINPFSGKARRVR